MHLDGALICLEEIHHQRFWINIFFKTWYRRNSKRMHDEIYCALRTPFYPSEYSGSLISFLFVSVMVK